MISQINNSVVKAFEILSLFNEGIEQISAATLATRFGMNAVSAHRFLRTLERTGALVAVSRGSYRLGYAIADLGKRAADPGSLAGAVQPVLEKLTRDLGEGSMATIFDGEAAVCIAKAVADRPLFVDVRKGSRLEAYATAHGKLWLAQLGESDLDRYFERTDFRTMTEATATTRAKLEAELDDVRRKRVAYNRGERESEIHGIAVPVLARSGQMICGLSVFGASARMSDEAMDGFIPALRDAAKNLSLHLYGDSET
ncbi:helix-turn-helix domain-containing protein [Aliihoeflea aestuarii]|uniref:IclR family transcriptional regulator n=1 Tax=Aliihoeflea aestuarii TaxID=453840 RepID=UPI002092B7BF|nr:IclR family transcriptional regulator [Aliihoeflea aestuarii]MCO6390845.1 helix-turn-helix domain-containing protein [Aliihoeflea aestuarii]